MKSIATIICFAVITNSLFSQNRINSQPGDTDQYLEQIQELEKKQISHKRFRNAFATSTLSGLVAFKVFNPDNEGMLAWSEQAGWSMGIAAYSSIGWGISQYALNKNRRRISLLKSQVPQTRE